MKLDAQNVGYFDWFLPSRSVPLFFWEGWSHISWPLIFFRKIRRFVLRTLPPPKKERSTSSQDEPFRVKFGILPNVSLIFFWMILGQAWCKLAATGAHGNASKNSLCCKAYGERLGLDGWIRIQLGCFSVNCNFIFFCFLLFASWCRFLSFEKPPDTSIWHSFLDTI